LIGHYEFTYYRRGDEQRDCQAANFPAHRITSSTR
jgi:hypothetical protein